MSNKIVIASSNQGKLQEFQSILHDFELIAQGDLHISDAIEDGLSFVENAIIKARHACLHSKLPAIADDSGLEVAALNGAPGIYSARYAGEQASDADNINKLLQQLHDTKETQRQARFRCVIVMLQHANDPSPLIFDGSWQGTIAAQPSGTSGFGYDPVFFIPSLKCTAAELDREQKNTLSHRAQALQKFRQYWQHANSPIITLRH